MLKAWKTSRIQFESLKLSKKPYQVLLQAKPDMTTFLSEGGTNTSGRRTFPRKISTTLGGWNIQFKEKTHHWQIDHMIASCKGLAL